MEGLDRYTLIAKTDLAEPTRGRSHSADGSGILRNMSSIQELLADPPERLRVVTLQGAAMDSFRAAHK